MIVTGLVEAHWECALDALRRMTSIINNSVKDISFPDDAKSFL